MSLPDCQSSTDPLFHLHTTGSPDVLVKDGDFGLDDTVSYTITVYDNNGDIDEDAFELVKEEGKVLKCQPETKEGSYLVEYRAQQENNLNRYAYYHVAINIGETVTEKKELLQLAPGLEDIDEWELDRTGANVYVVSSTNGHTRMQFVAKDSVDSNMNLVRQAQTVGFVVDHDGYVLYTDNQGQHYL